MSGQQADRRIGFGAVVLFGLVACLLYGIPAGLRGDVGILLNPLAAQTGLAYEDVSLCIAVMQLMFGATQPLFGIVASRRSNRFVLVGGVALLAASLAGMLLSRGFAGLMVSLGLLFGAGAGAVSFGLILTSAIRYVGPERGMVISGMLNASAGMGSFALSPILQGLLDMGGLFAALSVMLVPVAALVPVAFVVTSHDPKPARLGERPARKGRFSRSGRSAGFQGGTESALPELAQAAEVAVPDGGSGGARELASAKESLPFRGAFRNRTYLLLVAGFSTCGFHMVIIESHLFSQYVSYGIEAQAASWVFSLYGIATIAGALLSGWLSSRVHKGRLLGFYYGFRAVWTLAFLFLMPKATPFAVLFSIGLGMTGDATVSPTSGLVNANFSLRQVATLIGFLYFVHQIGAFLSAWLGGVLLSATGGYEAVWLIDVALCAFACIMSLLIRER